MNGLVLALAAAAALAASCARASEVKVEPTGPGAYRLTVTVEGSDDPGVGQGSLMPTAKRLCGREPVRLGRYTYDAHEPTGKPGQAVLTLVQDVRCGGPDDPEPEGGRPPKDEARIRSLSEGYFNAIHAGRYAEAYAQTDPDVHGGLSLEAWSAEQRKAAVEAGRYTGLRLVALSWADDPPGAPPGRYAAVDYWADAEKLAIECGYVVWAGQADGSWRLTRHERKTMTKAHAAKVTPEHMAEIKAALACAE